MFLAKPLGLLALLDEESRFPGATDQSLIGRLINFFSRPCYFFLNLWCTYWTFGLFLPRMSTEKFQSNIRSDYYIRHKANGLDFTVQHYAGRVTYDAMSFLEKNRNFLPPEVVQLLRTSSNPTVQFLFHCPLTKTGNLFSKSPYGSPVVGRKLAFVLPGANNKFDGKVFY